MRRSRSTWITGLAGLLLAMALLAMLPGASAMAQNADTPSVPTIPGISFPDIDIRFDGESGPQNFSSNIQILFVLTVLSLAPSILIMMTSFTRIVIVLGFLRQAMGTQQMPPTQIMLGLALFLTMFVMRPTWTEINETAVQPYLRSEITQPVAFERSLKPVRRFMFLQTGNKELATMMSLSGAPQPANETEVPTLTLVPAFVMSELKTAFKLAFLVYMPFVIIDLVVASSLMSVGVMMLPPMMISLPLKLLLFVLADGWNLIVTSLVAGFRT
jgi:flagellar biosynthesis protein FliP